MQFLEVGFELLQVEKFGKSLDYFVSWLLYGSSKVNEIIRAMLHFPAANQVECQSNWKLLGPVICDQEEGEKTDNRYDVAYCHHDPEAGTNSNTGVRIAVLIKVPILEIDAGAYGNECQHLSDHLEEKVKQEG